MTMAEQYLQSQVGDNNLSMAEQYLQSQREPVTTFGDTVSDMVDTGLDTGKQALSDVLPI